MFVCKNCKSVDKFELMFAPSYKGAKNYKQEYNKNGDIVITVDGYTFVPDLNFMNRTDRITSTISIPIGVT